MSDVRITDQTTDSALAAGDYIIIDSESEGTRKFDIGTEITEIKSDLGDLAGLETTDTSSLVAAINEALESSGGLDITDYTEGDIYLEDDGSVYATGITLSASTLTFTSDTTQTLTATLAPSDCTESVTWASADETIATVVGNGLTCTVTPLANSTTTITATTTSTALTASCTVSISGLAEEGVRYRLTGTDATTDTSQTLGGASVTFSVAPTIESEGIYLVDSNYMYIENANDWFADSWTMEIVFEPRLSSSVLSYASSQTLFDGKYGTLADGTSSTAGQTIQIYNPRDYGYLALTGGNTSIDLREYNNTECTIKLQYSSSTGVIMYFEGEQVKTNSTAIPSNKNIYFNGFNKSASSFACLIKSVVIRDGVV